jgi:hypothetical protein
MQVSIIQNTGKKDVYFAKNQMDIVKADLLIM